MFERTRLLPAAMLAVVCFFLLESPGALAGSAAKNKANDIKDKFNAEMRSLRAGNMFLPMSYLEVDGVAYGYFMPRRLTQLVGTGDTFRIRRLDTVDNMLKVELETDRKARIKIIIFDPEQKVSATLLADVFPRVLADVFNFGTPPRFPRVVVNTRSGLAHLGACNHLPADSLRVAFDDDASAEAAGHRLCPACFPPDPPLPYFNYMPTRIAALEATRRFERAFPPVADQALQDSVQNLGEDLVSQLPFQEKGFSYRFRVVESEFMKGQSFPAGFVYVTDKLLAAVETEAELAHVLAHEIAHCELHLAPNRQIPEPDLMLADLWKRYFRRVRWRETEADLVAISTIARRYPASDVAAAAISILSKLQFANEAIPLMEGNAYASRPPYGSRLEWLKNGYFPVRATQYFEGREKSNDWVCRVKVLGGGYEKGKTQVIHLLVQMAAGAKDGLETGGAVADDFGVVSKSISENTIYFPDGKKCRLVPRDQEIVYPGFMAIVTYEIRGLKERDYGISTAGDPKPYDPSDLEGIELSAPGKLTWLRVTAAGD